ncbi:MAG: TRIC cation channel family protein [Stellaceae bacterium]
MDTLLLVLDLIGTFVFALSGATAGVNELDGLSGIPPGTGVHDVHARPVQRSRDPSPVLDAPPGELDGDSDLDLRDRSAQGSEASHLQVGLLDAGDWQLGSGFIANPCYRFPPRPSVIAVGSDPQSFCRTSPRSA